MTNTLKLNGRRVANITERKDGNSSVVIRSTELKNALKEVKWAEHQYKKNGKQRVYYTGILTKELLKKLEDSAKTVKTLSDPWVTIKTENAGSNSKANGKKTADPKKNAQTKR